MTSAFQIRSSRRELIVKKQNKKMWGEAFDSYYEALCRYVPEKSENHKNTQIE
jgi:hypothetical protein